MTPRKAVDPGHRLTAVWFADIVGYTRLAAENEPLALSLVRLAQKHARKAVREHKGRVVKFLGDGALAEFRSTDAAVRAAFAFHAAFAAEAAAVGRPDVLLHTGIHLGDVTTGEDGDLYGDGINVAARLQEEARAGEVLISGDVWRQLRGRGDFRFRKLGLRRLKGVGTPIELFAAFPASAGDRQGVLAPVWKPRRRQALAFLGLGILIAIVGLGVAAQPWQRLAWRAGDAVPTSAALPPTPAERTDSSLAVLPFVDLSEGTDEGYFADGITEDILTALSRVEGLRVISRTSVMTYKDTDKPIRQIATELGVATILEGSVRRVGDRVRISAQLIDARTDEHLWAETYDRELTDIFAIQSEIAQEIATALAQRLSSDAASRIAITGTAHLPAYDRYLRGREALYRALSFRDIEETRRSNDEAIEHFRGAIELDSGYALAWAGLGRAFALRRVYDGAAWGDSSRAAATRAVELDPQLPEARLALAHVAMEHGEMTTAHRELHQAITLNPNHAEALAALAAVEVEAGRYDEALPWALRAARVEPTNAEYAEGVGYAYGILDDLEEGERWLRKSLEIDPQNASAYGWLTFARIFAGDDRGAARAAERALALGPNSPETWWPVVIVALRQGRYERARDDLERWASTTDPLFTPHVELAYVYQKLGDRRKAEESLRQAESVVRRRIERGEEAWWPYWIMVHLSALKNDREAAVAWFREASNHGFRIYRWIGIDPLLENVRDDPRMQAEVRKMKAEVDAMRERALRATSTPPAGRS